MTWYLLIMLVAAGVTYLSTPLVRLLAHRIGALTPLRDRDVHAAPVPRLGGVAMFAGLAVAFLVASGSPFLRALFDGRPAWGVLAAAALVCLVGALDDVFDLDPFTKLAGQVLAGGLMAWQGVQLVTLPLGGVTVGSGGLFLVLTVLSVVVTMNAVNFVDGLDGLAAGVVGIGASALFVYTYLLSREASPLDYSSLGSVVAAALVGCCVGFLPHNLHPAKIFMGDSGALLIGLLLAASAVSVTGQVDPVMVSRARIAPVFFPVLLPLAVLMLPLVDLFLAVVRRTARGQSPFAADRQHLHHRLLDLGHSHPRAVWVMYLWTAILSFGAVLTAFVPLLLLLPVWAAAILAAAALTFGPNLRAAAGPPRLW
ncbi:MAG: undecaprenyl-phosphate alpha-N-acetylglucosaminyl 1-phosphate transferase [Micrococcales bacterium]|nr:MAG: undecaprenyl-phosphate alpha-N-acetylglucosaminyl 1-phosphate transferase [Micrococcales bacterium]PIE27665.1 MAG: undecaprenyl-phosphate alpha-N-acetylglucosaminyl 1-phosphate transferase [Micrococcales bacterium]